MQIAEIERPVTAVTPTTSPFAFAAWLVDLDGTLYFHNPVRGMMAIELAVSGWPAIRILRAFRRAQEQIRYGDASCNGDSFQLQIERTAQQLGLPTAAVSATVGRWMFDRPGRWLRAFRRRSLLAAIADYRACGGKTALVSDYPARKKLSALGVESLFDVVVACGEPGGPRTLKPSPHGLRLAAELLNVSSHDCLVIGDRLGADGEAARRAGMAFRHVCHRWPRQ